MIAPYDAILFDFDGVLVDSEPLHCACWAELLAPFGVRLTWEDYAARFNGGADVEIIKTLSNSPGVTASFEDMWSLSGEKQAMFRRRILENIPMLPATRELLFDLAEHKLAVVSSSCRIEIESTLIQAGIRDLFSTLVCREDVSQYKPNPEPYLTAAARLNINRPLVVEDSDFGEAAGRAAGFDVVRVRSAAEVAAAVRAAVGYQ